MFKRHITYTGILLAALFITTICVAQDTKENAEFKLAVNLYNSGMYDLAADQFQNFINAYPGTANSIEARFYLGLTQMKLKRYEEARITFQNFALTYTDNPKAPEAWMRVGDAYVALQNDREAASAYERVKVFHPKSPFAPEALLKAALFYSKAGASENARKALRTIIQDYPSSSSVYPARLAMGELYIEDGKPELAQGEFSRVMESSTESALKARAMLLSGKMYLSVGRIEEAQDVLNRITSTYKGTSSYPAASFEFGMLLQKSGKYSEAIEHFKKAFSDSLAEPKIREQALVEMGNSYAANNDYSNALKQYEQFLAQFPASDHAVMVQFKAGLAAASSKNYQTALNYFQKTLSAKGNDAYKRKGFIAGAEMAVKLKDYAKAVQLYSAFLDRYSGDPANAEVVMKIGNLYENHLEDFQRAAGFYEDVSVKFSQSNLVDDALIAIGRCRESMGDIEGALFAYRDVVEQYPSSDYTLQAKERIDFLKNHKAKNRDAGMEKLALLVGEMLSGTSKAQLAFTLGEIYFHDLKDYRSAAKQFSTAIVRKDSFGDAGLNEDRFVDAYFYRARSYHLLSELSESPNGLLWRTPSEEPEAANQTITYYEAFLMQFPSGKWSDDAALYTLQLKSRGSSTAEVIAFAQEYLTKKPTSMRRPEILMILADAQETSNKLQEAVTSYSKVAKEFTNASIAEKAWLQLGKIYGHLGMQDSAAFAFTNGTAKFPRGMHTSEALWLLANVRMEQQKPKEAIEFYKRILSDYFYTSYAMRSELALGDAYLEAGQFEDAIALFQSLWEHDQSSPFEHQANIGNIFKLATAYNRKSEKQKAVEFYHMYLQYDRRSSRAADAYFALGVIARDQGKTESASAYFKQAAAMSGGGESNREIAELLYQTEQYAEAEKQFAQLAKSAKNESEKQYFESRIVISKLRMNDFKGADPLMKDFAKSYKKSTDLLAELQYEKGLYYFHNQDYTNAVKTFSVVADDYDKTKFASWAEYYLGKILEVTNKTQDAVKKYESILKRFPKSDVVPRIYLSLGNISYNAEKYQDAILHYQQVLESSEMAGEILPYAMNNLIDAYEAVQLYDAALQVTRTFIDRYPNDPSFMDKRINIGVLYTRLSYYDQSVLHLQNLLDEAGSDLEAEIRYAIGEAYYYKGDYQQAILEFLKVPYLVTKQGKIDWTATSFYMAGQAYEKMSKFDQAIAMYQQIIDRPGIDGTFKAAAKKEIDRVKTITKKDSK